METNLKAVVRYDGTNFAGWQVQPDQPTVQGAIQAALSRIAGRPIQVNGASRTDSGVHALGQVANWHWEGRETPDKLRRALSKMLSPDIRVLSVEPADEAFHATTSAVGKRYAYVVCNQTEPDPFSARYAYCVPHELDLGLLESAGQKLVGEKDFAGFGSAGSDIKTTVRTIHSLRVERGVVTGLCESEGHFRIVVHGNAFLYKMVRNISGTLLNVARGKTPVERIDELLASPGPFDGFTAPARGLFLMEVFYE